MAESNKFYVLKVSDKTKEKIAHLRDAFYCDAVNYIIENEHIDTDSNEDLLECIYLIIDNIV